MTFLILLATFLGLMFWSKKLSDKDNYSCYLTASAGGLVAIALICDGIYEIYKHVSVAFS